MKIEILCEGKIKKNQANVFYKIQMLLNLNTAVELFVNDF